MTAARNGSPQAVRVLLAHGADPNAHEETRGQTQPPLGYTTHYLRYRKEHLYQDWETLTLDNPIGTTWNYSVISMGTVGHILELATGQSFEDCSSSGSASRSVWSTPATSWQRTSSCGWYART